MGHRRTEKSNDRGRGGQIRSRRGLKNRNGSHQILALFQNSAPFHLLHTVLLLLHGPFWSDRSFDGYLHAWEGFRISADMPVLCTSQNDLWCFCDSAY